MQTEVLLSPDAHGKTACRRALFTLLAGQALGYIWLTFASLQATNMSLSILSNLTVSPSDSLTPDCTVINFPLLRQAPTPTMGIM